MFHQAKTHKYIVIIPFLVCLRFITAIAAPAPGQQGPEIPSAPHDKRQDARQVMQDLHKQYLDFTKTTLNDRCTEQNMIVRKEWTDLGAEDRRAWIRACKCLQAKPPQKSHPEASGVQNRWDEFVEAHMIAWADIHLTPSFFPSHRELLYVMERALRDECGYKGGQPYIDPSRHLGQAIDKWTMFDGSDTSVGGNGKLNTPGLGCTCVVNGPFRDWKVNLGPWGGSTACTPNPQADGLGLNTRCLERHFDLSLLDGMKYENVVSLIKDFTDPETFGLQAELDVHSTLHNFFGGEMSHIADSLVDPLFFLVHARLDMIWTIWMSLDFGTRTTKLAKAESYAATRQTWGFPEAPPSISLDTNLQEISPIFDSVKVRDVMWTTYNRYCYRYE